MSAKLNDHVCVGAIAGSFGVKGEVHLLRVADTNSTFSDVLVFASEHHGALLVRE